jgi:HprK-related kinase A
MMMRLGELASEALRVRLAGPGISLRIGPARARVRADLAEISAHLRSGYAGASICDPDEEIVDFELRLELETSLPAFERRARWLVDGEAAANALPRAVAYPAFEWTLNWAIATRLHRFFMCHAATAARDGRAIVMPGKPGSGKSTLCAGLVAARGWRLLSDEFLILEPSTGNALALARPIALKEASISALRRIAPDAPLGPFFANTGKGELAYLPAPPASQAQAGEPATPRLVVFPTHVPPRRGAALVELKPLAKTRAFMRLAENSFNYGLRGEAGFNDLRRLIARCRCYDLKYSDLDAALAVIEAAAADVGLGVPAPSNLMPAAEHASA